MLSYFTLEFFFRSVAYLKKNYFPDDANCGNLWKLVPTKTVFPVGLLKKKKKKTYVCFQDVRKKWPLRSIFATLLGSKGLPSIPGRNSESSGWWRCKKIPWSLPSSSEIYYHILHFFFLSIIYLNQFSINQFSLQIFLFFFFIFFFLFFF